MTTEPASNNSVELTRQIVEDYLRGYWQDRPAQRAVLGRSDLLPIFWSWDSAWLLDLMGTMYRFDEEQKVFSPETDPKIQTYVLRMGSLRMPNLKAFLPSPSPDSILCPICGGTGIITVRDETEKLFTKACSSCHGLGFLVKSEEK